jgi:hypothetical protein
VNIYDLGEPENRTTICKSEWDTATTYTGSIPGRVKGELFIRFNPYITEIDSFYVYCRWSFDADDAELIQNGYPYTKYQMCSGHDLPLWVDEPSQNRYIYGLQGSGAGDHIYFLNCEYFFPEDIDCAIDKFEFTDATLQMIRFDFYIP